MSNDSGRLRTIVHHTWGAALVAASLFAAPHAVAHELTIDEIELHLNRAGDALLGAVSFDPELTRKLDADIDEKARHAAVEFVQDNLVVRVNGAVSSCLVEVRELYVVGGAVPGDIVDLTCPVLDPGPASVRLELGKGWGPVALGIAGTSDSGEGPGVPIIRQGGEHSPTFRMHSTGPPYSTAPAASSATPTNPTAPSATPPTPNLDQGMARRLLRFGWLGFSHVLPSGMDHVLFVVGLVLGSADSRSRLLWQLSIFTVVHTVTLGLGAAGVPIMPGVVVEPLIALSIAWIAAANLMRLRTASEESKSARSQLWVIAVFGLVHGQGFSSVLFKIGFSRQDFWVPLISINFGVELGHLLVAAGAWGALWVAQRLLKSTRGLRLGASGVIGVMGLVWAVERIGAGLGWL